MIIYYTITEGGKWHKKLLTRKELNFILKSTCTHRGFNKTIAAIKTKHILYDFRLFKRIKTYFRKEYK